MKTPFVLIFLLACSFPLIAQSDTIKVYTWEEAKSASPDTVYGLTFSRMKLTQLPEELANFKQLRILNVEKNKLEKLPDFIAEFKYLSELNAGRNKLVYFPIIICRMPTIQNLILNRNSFEVVPECIEYARELRYLDLYDTPIRSMPGSLIELKHLEKIDFTGIRFSPQFQEKWIARLPNVELVFDPPCDCMK